MQLLPHTMRSVSMRVLVFGRGDTLMTRARARDATHRRGHLRVRSMDQGRASARAAPRARQHAVVGSFEVKRRGFLNWE